MRRVIFMKGCKAVLIDEHHKTHLINLEWAEDYEEIICDALEKGQEITFADYRGNETNINEMIEQ